MRTRKTITITALTAAGLLLTGCGGSADQKPTATPTATTATAAPATTPVATPSPEPTSFTLGQPQHWSGGGNVGTTTVLGYKQPVLQSDPPGPDMGLPAGSQWGRIDIKVCVTSGSDVYVTQEPWHVMFKDGSQADSTGLYGGDFPKPEFPQDRTMSAGQCARGGVMFPIPKGQRPMQVVYSPDSRPQPVYWDLPAK